MLALAVALALAVGMNVLLLSSVPPIAASQLPVNSRLPVNMHDPGH
jgi:hypothetical protein